MLAVVALLCGVFCPPEEHVTWDVPGPPEACVFQRSSWCLVNGAGDVIPVTFDGEPAWMISGYVRPESVTVITEVGACDRPLGEGVRFIPSRRAVRGEQWTGYDVHAANPACRLRMHYREADEFGFGRSYMLGGVRICDDEACSGMVVARHIEATSAFHP